MGGNRRYEGQPISPPAWAATLGAIKDHGTQVRAICNVCRYHKDADIDRMIAARGRDYSLWDRRRSCPVIACAGKLRWMYRPGGSPGTPFRPFKTNRA